ncbi:sulfotransferase [Silanimonas sp.]|jgi:hypothetical protein|uniref:sulfotransferase family protein n=1 Tax=Silanimonas sp. TaxID=1929290 RepID=UPI0022BFE20F|nr:sulfotransferase [Silanimonas sp.]MCZ8114243.1 sulfotransferase [Silanimonas sp.]
MPRLSFLVGGVQKAGTTAFASYLSRHPFVRLPGNKEAHVFDAPDYDESAPACAIDARFDAHFSPPADEPTVDDGPTVYGDATPITVLSPRFVERAWRYSPHLRWIILLREPVERAISHWAMERARGVESLPLWAAALAEPWRLGRSVDDWAWSSPQRWASYAARGDYARQLRALVARFPPGQILLLRSDRLAEDPEATVAAAWAFLGLPPGPMGLDYPRVFEGAYRSPGAASLGAAILRFRLRSARRAWNRATDINDWVRGDA